VVKSISLSSGLEVLIMLSNVAANFGADSIEHRVEQALIKWVHKYINACEIETVNPVSPKFVMKGDNVEWYRQAVAVFGELWVNFSNEGLSESAFMSAYGAARQSAANIDN